MTVKRYSLGLTALIALIALIFLTLGAGCSKNASEPSHGHLTDDNDDPQGDTYDFTPELRDNETRYTSDNGLSLHYNRGGVLVINDKETSVTSLIDLSSSHRVDFKCSQPYAVGTMSDAVLSVDGQQITTKSITCEHLNERATWISILMPDGSHAVLVLNIDN